jgi:NarL family two-component system response regulator LiaR
MNDSDPSLQPQPPQPEKIRILLVDDHAVVRQGLRTYLELQEDMQVVGEGSSGGEAVDLAARLMPDVIVLDLVMPGMDGVEATRRILEREPRARVLILTSFGDDDKLFPAIRAGAQGYLLKDIQPRDLIQAVRDLHHGKSQLHPEVARRLMSAVAGNAPARGTSTPEDPQRPPPGGRAPAPAEELLSLTEREHGVLDLIARGLSNREIAEKMVVSEATVKTHVSNLLEKLGLPDRTRAAIWALKHGLGSEG